MSQKELVEKVDTIIERAGAAASAIAALVGWHELVAPLDQFDHALTAAVPLAVAAGYAGAALAKVVWAKVKG